MRKATGRKPDALTGVTARVGLVEAEAADLKDSGCIQNVRTVLRAIKAKPTTNAPCMRSEGLRHLILDQGLLSLFTAAHLGKDLGRDLGKNLVNTLGKEPDREAGGSAGSSDTRSSAKSGSRLTLAVGEATV